MEPLLTIEYMAMNMEMHFTVFFINTKDNNSHKWNEHQGSILLTWINFNHSMDK